MKDELIKNLLSLMVSSDDYERLQTALELVVEALNDGLLIINPDNDYDE